MSDTIYVGQDVYLNDYAEDEWGYSTVAGGSLDMRMWGTVVDADESFEGIGGTVDVNEVQVLFWLGNRKIATGTPDADGYINVPLPARFFRTADEYMIRVTLAPNADFYMPYGDNELWINVS
jgi:hypothetical protein